MIDVWYSLDNLGLIAEWSADCSELNTQLLDKILTHFEGRTDVRITMSVKSVNRSQGDEQWIEQEYSNVSDDAKALPNELFTGIINQFYI